MRQECHAGRVSRRQSKSADNPAKKHGPGRGSSNPIKRFSLSKPSQKVEKTNLRTGVRVIVMSDNRLHSCCFSNPCLVSVCARFFDRRGAEAELRQNLRPVLQIANEGVTPGFRSPTGSAPRQRRPVAGTCDSKPRRAEEAGDCRWNSTPCPSAADMNHVGLFPPIRPVRQREHSRPLCGRASTEIRCC